jgi:tryprostatin B 6-hydroxylase
MNSSKALALAVVAGGTAHLGYFIRGEHHLYGARYIQIFTALFFGAIFLDVRFANESLAHAASEATLLASCYFFGLYASLLIYRAFFHPLNKFPGPFGNRLGNLWFSAQLGNADAYKQVLLLHKTYGHFVRVGSSDLSISHPKAINVIYGTGTKCGRAAFYNGDPVPSLISCRDRTVHDQRRRIWSPAFSDKALRDYAQRIKVYEDQLISRLDDASSSATSLNVSKWFNYYSFDAMGELAFGRSFDMLRNNQEHWAVSLLNSGLEALCFLFPIWLFRVLISIPGLLKDHARIVEFCCAQLDKRMKVSKFNLDIRNTNSILDRSGRCRYNVHVA